MDENEVKDAEEKVLHPKLHSKEITFLGKQVVLEPLPISVSKQIRAKVRGASKSLSKLSVEMEEFKGKENTPEFLAKVKDMMNQEEDNDLKMAEAVLDATWILCGYYGIKAVVFHKKEVPLDSIAILDTVCRYSDAEYLVNSQLELQEKNDFLLNPLAFIMMVLSLNLGMQLPSKEELQKMADKTTKETHQISPDIPVSVIPGESDSPIS